MHCIHQTPWKAGLVNKPEDRKYASFSESTGLKSRTNCNADLRVSLTGYDLSAFLEDSYTVLDIEKLKGTR
jgi:hypothetical protein